MTEIVSCPQHLDLHFPKIIRTNSEYTQLSRNPGVTVWISWSQIDYRQKYYLEASINLPQERAGRPVLAFFSFSL